MIVKEQLKLHKWAEDMANQRNSGLSQSVWCKQQGIKKSTFEYRCRVVREKMQEVLDENVSPNSIVKAEPSTLPEIAQINVERANTCSASGITIKLGELSVNIPPESNTEHVKLLMKVISNAK